jgi:AcrR family transcriptional regulator
MTIMARKYELRQRADAMEETRRRITDATINMHETVGPARTTVAAIAARAGVQRHTVYRHFPTDEDLFTACSTRYWDENPWPDVEKWRRIDSQDERLRTALTELYEFYSSVEMIMSNALRDASVDPVVERGLVPYRRCIDEAVCALSPADGAVPQVVTAAVRHAVAFGSWQSLVRECGLSVPEAVGIMTGLVQSAANDAQH